ncbi:MAG: hypothetical protein J6C17_05535 [Clostridia bacterium]|nr:hypothetical protein [Clostridia bacterium]
MRIKQLSIFVENKFGRLEQIIDDISKNGINISALSLADTTDFGILRLIVDDVDKARAILKEQGVISKISEVLAVVIEDECGGLSKALKVLGDAEISVEYMYAFVGQVSGKALMVFQTDDDEKAEKVFVENHIEMVKPSDVYRIKE